MTSEFKKFVQLCTGAQCPKVVPTSQSSVVKDTNQLNRLNAIRECLDMKNGSIQTAIDGLNAKIANIGKLKPEMKMPDTGVIPEGYESYQKSISQQQVSMNEYKYTYETWLRDKREAELLKFEVELGDQTQTLYNHGIYEGRASLLTKLISQEYDKITTKESNIDDLNKIANAEINSGVVDLKNENYKKFSFWLKTAEYPDTKTAIMQKAIDSLFESLETYCKERPDKEQSGGNLRNRKSRHKTYRKPRKHRKPKRTSRKQRISL